jgi:hypothetical protein
MVVVPALLSETAPQILAPKGARVTLVASLFSHATPLIAKASPLPRQLLSMALNLNALLDGDGRIRMPQ